MRGFGFFLLGSLGSLGVALSTALFRRLIAGPSKSRYIKQADEEDILLTVNFATQTEGTVVMDVPEVNTPLLKMICAVKRSDFTRDSEVCAREYGEDFFPKGDVRSKAADSPSRNSTVSGMSGATTETGLLGAEAYVANRAENETIREDDFSEDDYIFQENEYSLESPQLSPTKGFGPVSRKGVLRDTASPKSHVSSSEGEAIAQLENTTSSSEYQQSQEKTRIDTNGTFIVTIQSSDVGPTAAGAGIQGSPIEEDGLSASSESHGATEPEMEVQLPTAPLDLANPAVDSVSLVSAQPPPSAAMAIEEDEVMPVARGIVNPTPARPNTVESDLSAAPLSVTQVVDAPVSNDVVPTTAIDVLGAPTYSESTLLPVGTSTTSLAEAAGVILPTPVATVPPPFATERALTRTVIFAEGNDDVKENAGPVMAAIAGRKKARSGMFGSRRSSSAEGERGIKRFRLSDRIRMWPLRAVRSNSK